MAYNIVVQVSAQGADKIDQVEQKLDDASQAATRTTEALKKLGDGAAQSTEKASEGIDAYRRKLDEQWAAINQKKFDDENLKRINAPMEQFAAQLASIDRLLVDGRLSMDQYDVELSRLNRDLAKSQAGLLSDELKAEAAMLEQITAPLRRYEQDLAALDVLLRKDQISLEQYDAALAKVQKRAEGSGALAPVQGPKQQTVPSKPAAAAAGGGDDGGIGDVLHAVAPQLGQGGMLLSQFASGGVMAAAGAAALVIELGHLSDEYTTLSNKVERFSSDTQSADAILHQQLDLSKELHSSLEATTELYTRVRESTYQLNLSQRQQLDLAHDLGVELAAEGHGAEEAATLVRRLGLAFETGAISGRELRSIFKQFPEIGQELSDALGHTQAQLLQMANKGQLSAQQLVEAIHKIAPEAEKTVDRLHETYSTKFGHLWDEIKLSIGGAIDKINEADSDQAKVVEGIYERHLHAVREARRQLDQELQRNARTADITGAALSVGIDLGPFNKDLADKVTEVRMTARAAGVDIADAFEGARAKAQLYGTKIDEIAEQHAAKQIADDAKRIYDALHGADDLLDTQFKRWRDLASQVQVVTKALEQRTSLDAAAGRVSQEQRDLALQLANLKTDQTVSEYGKNMVGYAQGINTARAELDDLNRAARAGVIQGEALRQKYDALVTTLNDGRLPEVIKIWEGFRLPIEQAQRDFAALHALLRTGRIDLDQYAVELKKIADTHLSGEAAILSDAIAVLDKRMADGALALSTHDDAVRKLVASYQELHRTASGITYQIAPNIAPSSGGLLPNAKPIDTSASVDSSELRRILAQVQSGPSLAPLGSSDNAQMLNDQLERARQLANEFVAPAVKYEQAIKDITVAQHDWGLTEEQASALRRRAKTEYNQQMEALEAVKGPIEQYEAAQRKLNDQLQAGDISQKQYADGVDKAKETMLQATGAAQTFSGAMQINWIKLKQEADSFGATVANMAVADFGKLNDAIVTAANGGEVSWSQMADSMIQDLERVALKMAEIGLVKSAISAFAIGGGGGGGLADTGIGMEGWAGYATGGSFVVGGDGGTDTTPVAFRATRGERVTITPPGAYPYPQAPVGGSGSAVTGGGQAPVVHVHNHYDSSVALAAIASPAGQTALVNVLRVNAPAIRGALGVRG